MEPNPRDAIRCICSQYISHCGLEKHLQTKSHIDRITLSKNMILN